MADDSKAEIARIRAKIARRDAGIVDREEPTFLGSVGDTLKGAGTRVKEAFTFRGDPKDIVNPKLVEDLRIKAPLNPEDEPPANERPQAMKRGGKVKARGVGMAVKGHGRGTFR